MSELFQNHRAVDGRGKTMTPASITVPFHRKQWREMGHTALSFIRKLQLPSCPKLESVAVQSARCEYVGISDSAPVCCLCCSVFILGRFPMNANLSPVSWLPSDALVSLVHDLHLHSVLPLSWSAQTVLAIGCSHLVESLDSSLSLT